MTQLTDKLFAIPMPEGAESCEIRGAHPGRPYPLLSFYGEGEAVELPVGEYQIVVFNTATATEEDARKVVERKYEVYRDYDTDNFHFDLGFIAALDSLHSLLHSKNLDPKNNYAIIEKLK